MVKIPLAAQTPNHKKQTPIIKMIQVGILMGSDSDWQKINGVAKALDEFDVPYEVNVMSAHRTPDLVKKYAEEATERGLLTIICAAGGAAHLAGVVAAHTTLPVIGIPVATELSGGLDSLLSTVQMPGDIPVATVGVGAGGARNAGILAVQILALNNPALKQKLIDFRKSLVAKISAKNEKLKNFQV
jgi:phosphoribosylaminoimidazole carboxylase PurE protein